MKRAKNPDRSLTLVIQVSASISVASFFYYLQHNDLLLYGDAVAHINIARRVFDSRTPGILQLGTVWLPLPHLLMIPLLLAKFLWQTGIGGSIPSMLAFAFSVIGVFRLMRTLLPEWDTQARIVAGLAAAIFALNPNLIYLQTTAMTEPLYLAFFVWSVVFFAQAIRNCCASDVGGAKSSLIRSGFCLTGACLTRYDGWFLSAVMIALVLALASRPKFAALRAGTVKFILLAVAAPALWIAYNAAVYRNPLEFANGPYSAKAIEQKTAVQGIPAHPGSDDPRMAFKYFFKSSQLNMAAGRLQIFWVTALLFGTCVVVFFQRKLWPALLLWVPAVFYTFSIAYSGVPIFLPAWWPFSYYNARYGIEMLPAFSVITALGVWGIVRFVSTARMRTVAPLVVAVFAAGSYAQMIKATPVSLQEARVNSHTKSFLERQLAAMLLTLPPNATVLIYLGDHVGALERAGIPLSQTINEGNHRSWMRPPDPDGLWEKALAHPGAYCDFVIAFEGDPVSQGVNRAELKSITVLHVSGQAPATIYATIKK